MAELVLKSKVINGNSKYLYISLTGGKSLDYNRNNIVCLQQKKITEDRVIPYMTSVSYSMDTIIKFIKRENGYWY
jgi:hypothetical protein